MSPKTSDNHASSASEADSGPPRNEPEAAIPPEDARADGPGPEAAGDEGTGPSASSEDDPPESRSRDKGNGEASTHEDGAGVGSPDDSGPSRNDLEREIDHLNDRHLRLAAEFENYRKRVRAEKQQTWARAQADLVRRLVESVDDLQRVALLDPKTASVQDIVEGVDLVERKLLRALAEAGLEVLDPAGEDFDPNVMEAVMTAPASSEDEDDTVDMVLQRGYLLEGHLVRPARVSVRKHG